MVRVALESRRTPFFLIILGGVFRSHYSESSLIEDTPEADRTLETLIDAAREINNHRDNEAIDITATAVASRHDKQLRSDIIIINTTALSVYRTRERTRTSRRCFA